MLEIASNIGCPWTSTIGGIEHAILHFWISLLDAFHERDGRGAVSRRPFARLFTQGMVLNQMFYRKSNAGRVITSILDVR